MKPKIKITITSAVGSNYDPVVKQIVSYLTGVWMPSVEGKLRRLCVYELTKFDINCWSIVPASIDGISGVAAAFYIEGRGMYEVFLGHQGQYVILIDGVPCCTG